jgi:hypothetical protein
MPASRGGSPARRVIVMADSHTLTEDCRAMEVAAMLSKRTSIVPASRESHVDLSYGLPPLPHLPPGSIHRS